MKEGYCYLYNPKGFLHYRIIGNGNIKIVLHIGLLGSLLRWNYFVY